MSKRRTIIYIVLSFSFLVLVYILLRVGRTEYDLAEIDTVDVVKITGLQNVMIVNQDDHWIVREDNNNFPANEKKLALFLAAINKLKPATPHSSPQEQPDWATKTEITIQSRKVHFFFGPQEARLFFYKSQNWEPLIYDSQMVPYEKSNATEIINAIISNGSSFWADYYVFKDNIGWDQISFLNVQFYEKDIQFRAAQNNNEKEWYVRTLGTGMSYPMSHAEDLQGLQEAIQGLYDLEAEYFVTNEVWSQLILEYCGEVQLGYESGLEIVHKLYINEPTNSFYITSDNQELGYLVNSEAINTCINRFFLLGMTDTFRGPG